MKTEIKIPCRTCLVFPICKQRTKEVEKKGGYIHPWIRLHLYYTCKIFQSYCDESSYFCVYEYNYHPEIYDQAKELFETGG